MKKIVLNTGLIVSLTLLFAGLIFATAQEPDKILINGTEKMLLTNPLEDYYSDPEKRPRFMIEPFMTSSGNWRGYVATWEIDDGKLFLKKINSWFCEGETKESCRQVELAVIFPEKVLDGRVAANWFSGDLRIPDGKQLQYVHMGYGSTYERDIFYNVKDGKVGKARIVDNTKNPPVSEMESARRELQKLKNSSLGTKTAFGTGKMTERKKETPKREPKSGIAIVPGKGVFAIGVSRKEMETVVGDGEQGSPYEDVYFVEYPKAGVQISYKNGKDTVHVIFLYNNQSRYEDYVTPTVKTDKGIDWASTEADILKAYGKPIKDFSDESKSWRRLEYAGIDFLFQNGRLGRIGILGPDGN